MAKISPENAPHNHDFSADDNRACGETPPERDVGTADFSAEAHGFTGFERVGRGSTYRVGQPAATAGLARRLSRLLRPFATGSD